MSIKKTIKIKHVDKIEGHAGFVGDIINGDVKKARFEVIMGIRLFERIVVGRNFEEIPNISARICGVCPVVHYLTAYKAMEAALGIKVPIEAVTLRKLLMLGQVIQSHTLHVYFLSLSDFYDINTAQELVKKFPKYTKIALEVRDFGNEIIRVFGGRAVHPVSCRVGGFRKAPNEERVRDLLGKVDEIINKAYELAEFFTKLHYPKFERKTEYISLKDGKEYSIYNGNIFSSEGLNIPPSKFENAIEEIQLPYEVVKRVKRNDKAVMTGAIARLNNNHAKLNPKAKKILKESKIKFPCYNSFYNILAQVIEIVNSLEESKKLLKRIENSKFKNIFKPYDIKAGKGVGSIEAPRGTLYHYYELDKKGNVKSANIITPTAQLISNMEEDLKKYIPSTQKLTKKAQERKIKMLIRAYDPCITCTVH
jgi:sulfhydrogenase subunit alpha